MIVSILQIAPRALHKFNFSLHLIENQLSPAICQLGPLIFNLIALSLLSFYTKTLQRFCSYILVLKILLLTPI
jgi:hypothetical protein